MGEALALVERKDALAVVITTEQVDLIKRTIAADATDAELQLFFYDCKRRGVHPLDKLIHFTKREGKYTPVTAIDFFRSRAAETKEHAGTDDATFRGSVEDGSLEATVTVYRLVQGDRYAFTATARWSEYCPQGKGDFMWRKMPHGQLSKCAEGLALRKGFPQELDGLHTLEEMDQAGGEPPTETKRPQRASEATKAAGGGKTAAAKSTEGKPRSEPVSITAVDSKAVKNGTVYWIKASDGQTYSTFDEKVANEIRSFIGTDHQIRIVYEVKQVGGKDLRNYLDVEVVEPTKPQASAAQPSASPSQPELSDEDFGDFGRGK